MTKRILLFLTPFFLFAQANPDRQDSEALKRWLQDKRLVTMKEVGGDLSLSGEVRTEFQKTSEKNGGDQLRGNGSLRPMYAWDVEFNLMLDYRADRTWAAVKLEYDNDMGQKSGTKNKIHLEKAFIGARLVDGDTFTLDAEVGRRYLNNVYDSKIQFGSRYDGGLLRFSKAFQSIGNFYTNLGAFIVNDRTDHYGLVTEIGMLRIANTGLNLKYSLIDWSLGGENEKGNTALRTAIMDLRFRFLISQATIAYQFYPEWIGKKLVKLYAAALTNHIALRDPLARLGVKDQAFGKQNWGWYIGTSLGLLKKKHDWNIDTSFQWVQAQALPGFDIGGIGRGNADDAGLYSLKEIGTGNPTTRKTAVGKMNYYGFEINGNYLFTGNLMLNPSVRYSWTLDKDLGPNLIYNQCELELIYAF